MRTQPHPPLVTAGRRALEQTIRGTAIRQVSGKRPPPAKARDVRGTMALASEGRAVSFDNMHSGGAIRKSPRKSRRRERYS